MTIVDKKNRVKKFKKKGAKAPPLFYLFSILSYISYRCDKNTNLVRQKHCNVALKNDIIKM